MRSMSGNGSIIPPPGHILCHKTMERLIYCVDDEKDIRSLYEEALPMGGFHVKCFEDGASFYSAMKSEKPDLIVMDIMLPGEDGMSLLHELKAGEYSSIPVIMVSAKDTEVDKVKGLNEGAADYLSKPFGVMELLARINANLRKSEQKSHLGYKSLSLHEDTHEIFLNEKKMTLSLKEYDLLMYFIENPAKTLSKDELLRSVWGITTEIETRTLDMFVSRLRKKLAGSDVEIQTIRSVGYILR